MASGFPLPERFDNPRPPRRGPYWQGDVAVAVILLMVEFAVLGGLAVRSGFTLAPVTAAQAEHTRALVHHWGEGLLGAALIAALLAACQRAPWTACTQLLAVLAIPLLTLTG